VIAGGQLVGSSTVEVASTAPALYAANENGGGAAAALAVLQHPDGTQSTQLLFDPSLPAGQRVALPIDFGGPDDQLFLVLFGTGLRGESTLANVRAVFRCGFPPPVTYAGPQGEFAGLDQVNIDLTLFKGILKGQGEMGVVITVGEKVTNQVTINTGPAQ
jgi:uncharacterized protein (TIGR03437 family)